MSRQALFSLAVLAFFVVVLAACGSEATPTEMTLLEPPAATAAPTRTPVRTPSATPRPLEVTVESAVTLDRFRPPAGLSKLAQIGGFRWHGAQGIHGFTGGACRRMKSATDHSH